MEMIIRKAIPEDAQTIAEFQQKMAFETESVQLDMNIVTKGVMAVFDDEKKGDYFVAEKDGMIVGSLLTTFEWSDWRNGTVLWIQSVFILKKFRGQGIYKNMYLHIRTIVENDPALMGVRLYVEKTNDTAQKVYSKLGMDGDHYHLYEWLKN